MPLMFRLLLLVLLGLVPAVAIQVYNEFDLRAERERQLAASALHQAELVNADMLSIVNGARQLAAAIGNLRAIQAVDPTCSRSVAEIRDTLVSYKDIGLYDPSGRLECASIGAPPYNIQTPPEVLEALRSGEFVVGRYTRGPISGRGYLPLAYPVRSESGAIRGVITVSLNLDWLGRHLANLKRPPDSTIVIADRDGTVLARYPDHEQWSGKRFLPASMAYLNAPTPGNGVVPGYDGKDRLIGYVPATVPPIGIFTSVGLYKPMLTADLDRALWRGFGLIALAALLVVGTVLAIGNRIIRRPTALLLRGVGRWAGGDLDARVPVGDRRSEFGRLGAAFNAMADALQERERRLREAEERALARERDFSRLVIENSADAIVSYDRDFHVLSWNPAMECFSGLTARDAVGRPFFDALPSFRDTPLQAAMQDAVAGRNVTTRDCAYEMHDTGRKGFYEAEHAPLRDPEGGAILGGIAFIRDITERRELEANLVQAQKIEAVGQLTSGVAHDFNNLLAACLGNLELLRPKLTEPGQIRLADGAARAAERGAKLTEQLLAFSRRQHRDPRPVDLNALIADMEDMLSRSLGPATCVEKSLAADLWPVLADANQIELAVLNLALNGRDATPVGGRLLIETANLPEGHPRLPRDLAGRGDFVLIAVSDNGSGMPDSVAARAFEPFFTTKGPSKGSGLGLSMVYGMARQAGGTAAIRSQVGEGTTVSVFLPRTAAVLPRAAAGAAPSSAEGTMAARILLVDDDRDVREFTALTLRQFGHEVVEHESGWAAIEMVTAGEPFDMLVVDFAMPSINGAEVARRVRAARPDIAILLITGYAEADAGGLPSGVGMLKKPFRIAELAGAVDQAVAAARPAAASARVVPLRPAGGGRT